MTTFLPANGERWMAKRACTQSDAELFFASAAPGPRPGGVDPVAEAKALCRSCDVRDACLSYALENGEAWGVWGGLDEHERAALTESGAA